MARDVVWLQKLAAAYHDPLREPDLPLANDATTPDFDRRSAIVAQVHNLAENEPEDCWLVIQMACELPLSDEQIGLLGAYAFEQLMHEHGLGLINRVEAAAHENPTLRKVVDSVWTKGMDQGVIRGIKAIKASPHPRNDPASPGSTSIA